MEAHTHIFQRAQPYIVTITCESGITNQNREGEV
jgi:hypothetical protein